MAGQRLPTRGRARRRTVPPSRSWSVNHLVGTSPRRRQSRSERTAPQRQHRPGSEIDKSSGTPGHAAVYPLTATASSAREVSTWSIGPTLSDRGLRVIGQRWSPRVHELKRFLARQPRPVPLVRPRDRFRGAHAGGRGADRLRQHADRRPARRRGAGRPGCANARRAPGPAHGARLDAVRPHRRRRRAGRA